MPELLRLEGCRFAYRPHEPVLDGLFLQAAEGEIVGIVGPNGAGKSTLFRCLSDQAILGAAEVSATVFCGGELLERGRRWRRIAWMAQANAIPEDLGAERVFERFVRGPRLRGLCRGDPLVAGLAGKRVGMLSGGERRYLEFLVTLGLDRPVTILDEPFSEMAPRHAERMRELMAELAPGRCFIVADHDWRSVLAVATRLEWLVNGRLHPVSGEEGLRRCGYLPSADA